MHKLNTDQKLAYQKLIDFINSDSQCFLLLGSAGSGKTTVIINFFAETSLKIAFCAFTNKATQVLRKTAEKFNIKFSVSFGTIHQILSLRPYLDEIGELKFLYQKALSQIKKFDIVIFDECSCISKDLLFYITDSKPDKTKLIFLGDNWQLPPINEELSKTFHHCGSSKAILKKVMRSTNTQMELFNTNLQEYITHFKSNNLDKLQEFYTKYPYSIFHKSQTPKFINNISETYLSDTNLSKLILTYTNSNKDKLNTQIQELKNKTYNFIPHEINLSNILFNPGDKCTINSPVSIYTLSEKVDETTNDLVPTVINLQKIDISIKEICPDFKFTPDPDKIYIFQTVTDFKIYNGDIFNVVDSMPIKIFTSLNKYEQTPKYFNAQLLTLSSLSSLNQLENPETFVTVNISQQEITETKKILKKILSNSDYHELLSGFYLTYPVFHYGYCLTLYKAQGSEYTTIIVNLKSIYATFEKKLKDNTNKIDCLKFLFKSSYTSVTRATTNLYLYWW